MSHVYSVYDGPRPADYDEAHATLAAIDDEDMEQGALPPSPAIANFLNRLLATWPDIGTPEGRDSPWAAGPMANEASGRVMHFAVVYSRLEEVTPFILEAAEAAGVVLLDQQEEQVLVPRGDPTSAPLPESGRGRRFFGR